MSISRRFAHMAKVAAGFSGRPLCFALAVSGILLWALIGPVFGYSDTWQLVVNTATTIITFLMVFLIQNTQNRDTEAIQIKLDELIRVSRAADNRLLDLENMEESELEALRHHYEQMAAHVRGVHEQRRARKH